MTAAVYPPDRVILSRKLASLLSADTDVSVELKYDKDLDHYIVRWTGGPCEEYMQALAAGHAHEVDGLKIHYLTWERS